VNEGSRTQSAALFDERQEKMGHHLQCQLVDPVDLGLQAKQGHRNVVGPTFRSPHRELDERAETCEFAVAMAWIGP
jgi:DNA-binding ferritin-like protein